MFYFPNILSLQRKYRLKSGPKLLQIYLLQACHSVTRSIFQVSSYTRLDCKTCFTISVSLDSVKHSNSTFPRILKDAAFHELSRYDPRFVYPLLQFDVNITNFSITKNNTFWLLFFPRSLRLVFTKSNFHLLQMPKLSENRTFFITETQIDNLALSLRSAIGNVSINKVDCHLITSIIGMFEIRENPTHTHSNWINSSSIFVSQTGSHAVTSSSSSTAGDNVPYAIANLAIVFGEVNSCSGGDFEWLTKKKFSLANFCHTRAQR